MRTCSSFLAGLIVTLFSYPSRAAVLYVDVNSGSASPPYTNWASAANKIQDAVDLATDGDLILVADGVYYSGNTNVGGGASRVVLLRQVTVQSVNGPAVTTIAGQVSNPAIRSVHMNDGAKLIGFTLSGGRGVTDGGGALCAPGAILSNCVISGSVALRVGGGVRGAIMYNCRVTGNSAPGYNSIYNGYGGGVYESTCYNCTLDGNWANYIGGGSGNSTLNGCLLTGNYVSPTTGWGWGGAAWGGTLNGCTVVNNWIYYGNIVIDGGGTSSTTVSNSIVYNNTPNNISAGTVNYCCTIPLPAEGEGN